MPIFFFVGGFANAASWRAAHRQGSTYGSWLRARLRRLVLPVLPLLIVWTAGAYALLRSGFDPDLLENRIAGGPGARFGFWPPTWRWSPLLP